MNRLYYDLLNHKCLLEQQVFKNSLIIVTQSPDEFAYHLMKGPGYISIIAGEVAHIIKCIPVEVKFRQTEECCLKPKGGSAGGVLVRERGFLVLTGMLRPVLGESCTTSLKDDFSLIALLESYYGWLYAINTVKQVGSQCGNVSTFVTTLCYKWILQLHPSCTIKNHNISNQRKPLKYLEPNISKPPFDISRNLIASLFFSY